MAARLLCSYYRGYRHEYIVLRDNCVVDLAKLHGRETTRHSYYDNDTCVVDPAKLHGRETTVQSTLRNCMAVRLLQTWHICNRLTFINSQSEQRRHPP